MQNCPKCGALIKTSHLYQHSGEGVDVLIALTSTVEQYYLVYGKLIYFGR